MSPALRCTKQFKCHDYFLLGSILFLKKIPNPKFFARLGAFPWPWQETLILFRPGKCCRHSRELKKILLVLRELRRSGIISLGCSPKFS